MQNFNSNNPTSLGELLKTLGLPHQQSNPYLNALANSNYTSSDFPPAPRAVFPSKHKCQIIIERINKIMCKSDTAFEELDYIPARSTLTYKNGFYVMCSAIFIDIRGSSQLTALHTRPKLAKLYRAFTSEMVALLRSENAYEIGIRGDCVFGIFNTRTTAERENLLFTAAKALSILKIINHKLIANSITPINIGIGLSYGRALVAKAGQDGGAVNDLVWLGNVVNESAKLCSYGNKEDCDFPVMISESFYNNLSEQFKNYLESYELQNFINYNFARQCYHASIVFKEYENWISRNI